LPVVNDVNIYLMDKNSSYLALQWNKPKAPNGPIKKYSLYITNKLIYEGLSNNFTISDLQPNTYFVFYLIVCNNFGCSDKTKSTVFSTDEAKV
jgi:hypothetical protein